MKITIGKKVIEFTIRDVIYWAGLVGMGVAWYTTDKIDDAKDEIRIVIVEDTNEKQDEKIEKLDERDYEIIKAISSLGDLAESD
jgi:hypothetical protein